MPCTRLRFFDERPTSPVPARCGAALHRPHARATGAVRRQGAGPRAGADSGVPLMPGNHAGGGVWRPRPSSPSRCPWRGGIVIKAVAGGGGRGMRAVTRPMTCRRLRALPQRGAGRLCGRRCLRRAPDAARHIEVQVLGDGRDGWVAWASANARCSGASRSWWRLAPSPACRRCASASSSAALRMARAAAVRGLGTFEFLVDLDTLNCPSCSSNANPRLQVEHTITEEVTGRRPGAGQMRLAAGPQAGRHWVCPRAPPRARLCGSVAHQRRTLARTARHPSGTRRRASTCQAPACGITHARGRRHATPPHYDTPAGQADRARARPRLCRRAAPLAARWPKPHRRRGLTNLRCCARWPHGPDGQPAGAHALAGVGLACQMLLKR